MMTAYEKKIEELTERACEKHTMPLYDLIMSEDLKELELGTLTILAGDEMNNAIVPCEGFLILVREYHDEKKGRNISEYAIYSEQDRDGHPLLNSLNYNSLYRLEYVGEEGFVNMASAIVYAHDLIYKLIDNERSDNR